MKKYRAIALLLTLVMLFALVAGCGQKEEPADEPDNSAQPSAPAEPAEPAEPSEPAEPDIGEPAEPSEPVYTLPLVEETETITYFFYMNGQNLASIPDPENLLFFELAEAATNVHVDYTLFGSYNEDWSIMLASGEYCDIIDNVYNYPGGYGQALADGFVAELSEIIPQYMPNYHALRQRNEEYYKNTMLDNGDIAVVWGLLTDDRGDYPAEYGPSIRKDWLDEQGLELPETYDDWYEVLKVFKQEYGATMWAPSTGVTLYGLFGAGFGVNGYTNSAQGTAPYYIDNGEVKFGATTDEYKEFLMMFSKWYDEGLIDPDFMSIANPYAPDQGDVINGRWGIFYCIKDLIDVYSMMAGPGFQLAPIADPVKVSGDINNIAYPTTLIQKQNSGICATSENIELAAKWLDFWFCEEGIMIANYGEEGYTYDYDENGEPYYTEFMTANPDGKPLNTMLYAYARNQGTYMNLWYKTLATNSQVIIDAMEVWSVHKGDGTYPDAVTMTTEEVTEHTALITDILVYVQEYTTGLMIGSASFDDWDDFVAQVEGMNIGRCLEIKQAAYDRYLNRG